MPWNKSEIMKRAWEIVRQANVARFGIRLILRNALRTAWHEAKTAVAAAKREALAALPRTAADNIREALFVLECKTHWTPADYAHADELRRAAA